MHGKLALRLVGCLLMVTACSGDDASPAAGSDAAHDAGQPDAAASNGAKGTGSGKEGVSCASHADCAEKLSCLVADARDETLKVCARPCEKDSDCDGAEICRAETGAPKDALCWNIEGEALKPCGPEFTSKCDAEAGLGCLRVEDDKGSVAGGVCLAPCTLPADGEDDPCSDDLTCLNVLGKDDEGVCGDKADRGEVCDEPNGKFCGPGDFCLSDGDEWRCYQDCTESDSCDDGKTCRPLPGDDVSYCE